MSKKNVSSAVTTEAPSTTENAGQAEVQRLMPLLFLAGAESVATQLDKPATQRSGESEENFEYRKGKEATAKAIAASISNANPSNVFTQLVNFAAFQPVVEDGDDFEQKVMRNRHLMDLVGVIQRIQRASTTTALFTESVIEARLLKPRPSQGVDDVVGSTAQVQPKSGLTPSRKSSDDLDLGLTDELDDLASKVSDDPQNSTSSPEDHGDATDVISPAKMLLNATSAGYVIEALEGLYDNLSKFSLGVQQQITGLAYEARLLSLYSVSTVTPEGTEWKECLTVDEARMAYNENLAQRAASNRKQQTNTLNALASCFS